MSNIIIIVGFIVSVGVVIYSQNKYYKKLSEEISKINLKEINSNINKKSQSIIEEVKKINTGKIEIENGIIKGDLFVEGNINAKDNIRAFVRGDE